jgi:hypothetical protein
MDQQCSPEIREVINSRNFDEILKQTEKTVREALKWVIENVLGRCKASK